MSKDAADLMDNVTLCFIFPLRKTYPSKNVHRLCEEINAEGDGVIGVSTHLAPNSMLLIGQNDTVESLKDRKAEITKERISVRINEGNGCHYTPMSGSGT